MRIRRWFPAILSLFAVLLAMAPSLRAQITQLSIPAGSPADVDLQAISKESDPAKQKAMYTEFVAKYAADPMATAYGYSQLAQLAAQSDAREALEYGDKALAAVPGNLDLYVSQTTFAQAAGLNDKTFDYAARGGKLLLGADEDQKRSAAQAYEFLESSAYAAIAHEAGARQRLAEIERFKEAFPGSRYEGQVSQLAMLALQQSKDAAGAAAYGEKVLAEKPDEIPVLLMMADMYADDPRPANVAKAVKYAEHAVALAKADEPDADEARKLSAAIARSALGRALMRQNKMAAAVAELKKAAPALKQNPQAYSSVLFYLANAYSLQRQYAEAKQVLNEAVAVQGPFQQQAKGLLTKVNAELAKGR